MSDLINFDGSSVETTQAVVETTVPVTVPTEEPTVPVTEAVIETSVPEETNEISETLANVPTEGDVLETFPAYFSETVPVTTEAVVTVEIIETASSNITHASLFGSFLICGTLVGLFLLRGRYGT